jgi:hypothetical protein
MASALRLVATEQARTGAHAEIAATGRANCSSGWAELEIWKQVSSEPSRYFGAIDVSAPLTILGDAGRQNEDHIAAIFEMIEKLSRYSRARGRTLI